MRDELQVPLRPCRLGGCTRAQVADVHGAMLGLHHTHHLRVVRPRCQPLCPSRAPANQLQRPPRQGGEARPSCSQYNAAGHTRSLHSPYSMCPTLFCLLGLESPAAPSASRHACKTKHRTQKLSRAQRRTDPALPLQITCITLAPACGSLARQQSHSNNVPLQRPPPILQPHDSHCTAPRHTHDKHTPKARARTHTHMLAVSGSVA